MHSPRSGAALVSGTKIDHRSTLGLGIFVVSIFSSAFLIFAVQPMVAKHILPWFGGTPGVWLICLAFYQSALFLGYAYAYWLIARIPASYQPVIHGAVFIAAIFVLPVLPDEGWKPVGSEGASGLIFAMLVANVALPFVWLASTGPLVQAWFARLLPGQSPYPLYSVSNFGSLLALVSYPFFFEPRMALSSQSAAWVWSFAVCGLAVIGCAAWAAVGAASASTDETTDLESRESVDDGSRDGSAAEVDGRRRAFWILFPACAVILFMGVTNQLCMDIASVPLLWILPLSIYLATLILCFASEKFYPRALMMGLVVATLVIHIGVSEWDLGAESWSKLSGSILAQIGLYSAMLFFGCMVAHGELYRLRPVPALLTQFYLCVAGGGALGGLLVGIVAPRIFRGYYELPIGVVACWLLTLAALRANPTGVFAGVRRRQAWAFAMVLSVALFAFYAAKAGRPEANTVVLERGFFGILRVLEGGGDDPWTLLRNGTTRHGMQFRDPDWRGTPTTYYGSLTGVGLVLRGNQASKKPMKVGVVGLGVGTLAAYGRRGDEFIFYEIDPEVVKLAADTRYFSYLEDTSAKIEIVVGDARLSLESELRDAGSRAFNLLVIDAFSSDSIPMHLLTREAFELFDRHLARGGILAVHITNRHLELSPLIFRLGFGLGMKGVFVRSTEVPRLRSGNADWIILSRSAPYLQRLANTARARGAVPGGDPVVSVGIPVADKIAEFPIWTDDYSNIFSALRPVWP